MDGIHKKEQLVLPKRPIGGSGATKGKGKQLTGKEGKRTKDKKI